MRKYKRFFQFALFLSLILGLSSFVMAQSVSFEVTVDRKKVELGTVAQLNLAVKGAQSAQPIQLPEIDGFQIRYLGPSTSVTIINGQYSSSVTFMYSLYPFKVGTFEIPALEISVDGQKYTSDPISIEVTKAGAMGQGQQAGDQNQMDSGADLQDRIFTTIEVPRKQVYINEKVPLTMKLYVNDLNIQNIQQPDFAHVGFSVDEFAKTKVLRQVIGGVDYNVFEFRVDVYPTRTGELTLGPARIICDILFKRSRNRMSRMDSIFNDEFFDNFFDSYDSRQIAISSPDIKILVSSVPEKNKAADFSGAVGQFGFDASLSPTSLKVGDPITLKMQVVGTGNLKAVNMPTIDKQKGLQNDFKFYDPKIREENGVKILEQVVIPKSDQIKEFSEIRFSYFDINQNSYRTITKGPFPLSIAPTEGGESLTVVGMQDKDGTEFVPKEQLGRDISFIKEQSGGLRLRSGHVLHQIMFFFSVIIFIVAWVGLFIAYRFTHRMKTDVKFAKRFAAPRYAKKGLSLAKQQMLKDQQQVFYDTLYKTLQQYLSHKFHIASGSVNVDSVGQIVERRNLNGNVLEKVKIVFSACEMVRYASVQLNKDEMQANYQRTEEIIDFFERS